MPLEGKRAIVTGAGRGIGAAIARSLASEGASIVVAARTSPEVEAVAEGLRESGARALAAPVDVAEEASVARLSERARGFLGGVDILVNAAGVAFSAPVKRLTLEDWNRALSVNATGTFLCTRAFLAGMLDANWGRIVNVASVAGLAGGRYIAAYAASKHAVIGFTRSLAAELVETGVTANAVCPGYADTGMTAETLRTIVERTGLTRERALASLLETTHQTRLVTPEEVAYHVVSLCHDEASGVNGQAIVIDGGGLLA
jgi:NAD(P)-dependent dehydrogenase (short-subunit alcohol dehydrogenase family)